MRQPDKKAITQGIYKQVGGVWHKRCAGPAHDEPTFLPATDKYFYQSKSDGRLLSQCRLCQAWSRVKAPSPGMTFGKVEIDKVRHFYQEAALRIGRNELARRTGLNRQSLSAAIDGKVKFVRKANVRKVMLELVSIQRKGEHHNNNPWILAAQRQAANAKRKVIRTRDIKLHDQEFHLFKITQVKSSDPDPKLWHFTGQEWLPRYGEEMLGPDF